MTRRTKSRTAAAIPVPPVSDNFEADLARMADGAFIAAFSNVQVMTRAGAPGVEISIGTGLEATRLMWTDDVIDFLIPVLKAARRRRRTPKG